MACAYGIVLTDDGAYPLEVSALFRPGDGKLHIDGRFTSEVHNVVLASIEAITLLEPYFEEISSDKFSYCDLTLRMSTQGEEPVAGESYGLPLAMALVSALAKKKLDPKTCFTGIIDPGGAILAVEEIERKRLQAANLGFTKLVLPAIQLDVFDTHINQVPVDSLMGAITGSFWER